VRDPVIAAGLARIRRRRWCLWGLIAVYLPAIWLSLRLTRSDAATAVVFGVWFVLVIAASCVVAFSRCPRCGHHFHMNGPVPLWLRRCLHCELHLTADRTREER